MQVQQSFPRRTQRAGIWISGSLAVFAAILMVVVGYPLGARGPVSLGVFAIIATSVVVSVFMIGAEVYRRYSAETNDYESTASAPVILALEVIVIAAIVMLFFLLRYG